jgi:hypothetical protein
VVTARPAVVNASTRVSRSQRNFTQGPLLFKELNSDSDSNRGCGLWMMDH